MIAECALKFPLRREWQFSDDFEGPSRTRMLEFRLIYQGLLYSSGNKRDAAHIHNIRRYFHKQLVNAWKTKYPLKSRSELVPSGEDVISKGRDTDADELILIQGNKRFLPIVHEDRALVCSLDILLLSRNFTTMNAGDLDGRLKTLIDALKMPAPESKELEGDEDPLYCLLRDDKLVSQLRVTADLLLCEPEQIIEHPRENIFGEAVTSVNHALAVIDVTVKPTRVMVGNLDFV